MGNGVCAVPPGTPPSPITPITEETPASPVQGQTSAGVGQGPSVCALPPAQAEAPVARQETGQPLISAVTLQTIDAPQTPLENAWESINNSIMNNDWGAAARELNGLNLTHLSVVLAHLKPEDITNLRKAAETDRALGPNSNAALLTGFWEAIDRDDPKQALDILSKYKQSDRATILDYIPPDKAKKIVDYAHTDPVVRAGQEIFHLIEAGHRAGAAGSQAEATEDFAEAAKKLNGLNMHDMLEVFTQIDSKDVPLLRTAALHDPGLGPESNIAKVTGFKSAVDRGEWMHALLYLSDFDGEDDVDLLLSSIRPDKAQQILQYIQLPPEELNLRGLYDFIQAAHNSEASGKANEAAENWRAAAELIQDLPMSDKIKILPYLKTEDLNGLYNAAEADPKLGYDSAALGAIGFWLAVSRQSWSQALMFFEKHDKADKELISAFYVQREIYSRVTSGEGSTVSPSQNGPSVTEALQKERERIARIMAADKPLQSPEWYEDPIEMVPMLISGAGIAKGLAKGLGSFLSKYATKTAIREAGGLGSLVVKRIGKDLAKQGIERGKVFFQVSKQIGKKVGKTWLAVQGAGVVYQAGRYFLMQEKRTSALVTPETAFSELAELQKDPDKYINGHYTNGLVGIPIGDNFYNMNGHLFELTKGGQKYFFRRVPEDLYKALLQAQAAKNNLSGQIFVKETIRDQYGQDVLVDVEIRPPYRSELNRDSTRIVQHEKHEGGGPSVRVALQTGPEEGNRPNITAEFTWFHPYNVPSYSIRHASQTLTQGTSWEARNMYNTQLTVGTLNIGAWDFNRARVIDHTDPNAFLNGTELQLANGRVGIYLGQREMTRLVAKTGHKLGSTEGTPPDGTGFVRYQQNGYLEAGLGLDALRVTTENGDVGNINGFFELQFLAPHLGAEARRDMTEEGFYKHTKEWRILPELKEGGDLFHIDLTQQFTFIPGPQRATAPFPFESAADGVGGVLGHHSPRWQAKQEDLEVPLIPDSPL